MDRMIYVAMSGAKETLRAQASNSHNLANASTTGFRADLTAFMARAVQGPGWESRSYATTSTVGWDALSGAVVASGRDLDVAVNGAGWIAVQDRAGAEAYTRAGDLRIDASGQLRTGAGHVVLGDGGPIVVPPAASLLIGSDGTISIVPAGQSPNTVAAIARIKLVNPADRELARGEDGLFRLPEGREAPADAGVRLATGALESSNVNAATALVNMIELSRRFDLQVRAIRTADENARAAATLLRMA
jgi:flagellar basal-body rod protein FlgF